MVFLDDLKEMTLYKKPFVLPIDEENIRKGSAIFLVSPNAEASKAMMNYPYMINKMNTFNSYYLEKNANYYINQEGNLIPIDRDDEYLHEVSEEELEEGFFNKDKQKKQDSDSGYDDFLHKNYVTESEWKSKYRSVFIATYKACIRKAEFIGKQLMNGEAVKNGIFSYPDLHDDWPSSEMIKYMDRYEGGPNDRKSGVCLKSLVVVETDFSGYSPKSSVDAILNKIEKDLNDCIPTKYKDESQKMFFRIQCEGGKFILMANSIIMHESAGYDGSYIIEERDKTLGKDIPEQYRSDVKKVYIDCCNKAIQYIKSKKLTYIDYPGVNDISWPETPKQMAELYFDSRFQWKEGLLIRKRLAQYSMAICEFNHKNDPNVVRDLLAICNKCIPDKFKGSKENHDMYLFVTVLGKDTDHAKICLNTNHFIAERAMLESRADLPDNVFGLPDKRKYPFNEAGTDEFEYSNSFSDVMKVVNSLPKKDLLRICDGRFKDSPYVIYREVLSVSGCPVSFIDVYKLPNMEEDGCIVLATNPKWRGKGLASTLVERMKHAIGDKNLVWKTQLDNHASLAIAKSNGYSPVFNEAGKGIPLTDAERASLSDSDFGIPSQRRYPMTDPSHVKSAIRFFNYVDSEHEAELAKNIKRKAIEFKVPIRCGEGNRLSKYITEEYVQEFMSVASIGNDMTAVVNGTIKQHMAQGDMVYSFDHQKPYTKKIKARKPITESYVFSKDDMYINYDKFESGKSNVLLVTGLSGSGKSTLASKIKGAEWIELDIYETANCFTDDQLKQAGQVFIDFFDANPDRDAERKKRDYTVTVEDIRKFCKYAISWCNRHKEKKWVVDGVQIYSVMDYDDVKSYPMIIKGTSMVKSIIGRFKRNGEGKINWKNELSNEFLNLIGWYKDEEKILRNFKKAIIEEDANEYAGEPEDVFFDDMIKDIEKFCNEEPEPFPTDVLNEKKGSH